MDLFQDLRLGLRTLLRPPRAPIAVAVVAMAAGIGAAVAIWSVVDVVLLRPLPYPHADRIVMVWNQYRQLGLPEIGVSEPEVADYGTRCTSLAALAAVAVREGTLLGAGDAEEIRIARVSPAFFRVLATPAGRGRVFAAGEDRDDAPRVAVLSDTYWRRRFGADPHLVGRDLLIDGDRTSVVGVMPASFRYPEDVDLWLPLRPGRDAGQRDRANHYLHAVARLGPGVSLRQAQAQIMAVALQLQREIPAKYPDNSGWGAILVPLQEELTGDIRPALLLVFAAVALVLLMACANVANLLLERALDRSREIAVRTALGEPRGRLVRRFVAESLLVTCAGGAAGLLIAAASVRTLTRIDPQAMPRAYDIGLDGGILLFALALALLSGLAIGLVPALQSARLSLTGALQEGGEKTAGGRRGRRVRRLLGMVETALALVLVIGAGLLLRTFARVQRVDLGFDTAQALSVRIALPLRRYPMKPQADAFFRQLTDAAAALPGVRHAGVVDCLPLSGCNITSSFYPEDHMPAGNALPPEADLRFVSWDYFAAMGARLVAGRAFTREDRADSPHVVVVDEELARQTWPGENPLGKHLKFTRNTPTPQRTVVGVVRHLRSSSLEARLRPQVYVPFPQFPFNEAHLVLRADADPAALAGPLRALVRRLDPGLPIFDAQTMTARRQRDIAGQRLSMSLLLSLATLALFLAAVGMYSVMAYSASQRSREIGVRMALGARRRDILGLVVGEGLLIALLGVAVGLALAVWGTQLLGDQLAGVSATDLATYLTTSLLLLLTAAAASYLPARRAVRAGSIAALSRS